MSELPSRSLSENPKPVVSHVEPSAIQNRKWAGLFAIVLTVTFGGAVATAQQPRKTPHVGLLYASAVGNSARIQAFREGLRELGYVEGKTSSLIIATRRANLIAIPFSPRSLCVSTLM
jgi:hypothetical protein